MVFDTIEYEVFVQFKTVLKYFNTVLTNPNELQDTITWS